MSPLLLLSGRRAELTGRGASVKPRQTRRLLESDARALDRPKSKGPAPPVRASGSAAAGDARLRAGRWATASRLPGGTLPAPIARLASWRAARSQRRLLDR